MDREGTGRAISARGIGLCGVCTQAREVVTPRGSMFVLCHRSLSDDRFPKYPRLPVLECPGHERAPGTESAGNR
ncbi:MAG: hypothetical protein ABJA98_10030 [Acidobacteriota bacterium]